MSSVAARSSILTVAVAAAAVAFVVGWVSSPTTADAASDRPPIPVVVSGPVPLPVEGAVDVTSVPAELLDELAAMSSHGLRTPVYLSGQITSSGGQTGVGTVLKQGFDDFVVPEGQQFVVEYVSLETFGQVLTGDDTYLVHLGSSDDPGQRFHVGQVRAGDSPFGFGPPSGELVSIRFQEGAQVGATLWSTVRATVNVDVSGYLEAAG